MTQQGLVRDERGTILVTGLFAAAFLIGAVYLVLGVGDTVEHREVMQDSADTGAFSMAVLHARAMNMIALLNMVKLSIAATLTSLIAITVAAAKTVAFISSNQATLAALGAAIPLLVATGAEATADFASIKSDTDAVLRAADRAQETLRQRLPEIAEAQSGQSVAAFGDPVKAGFSPMRPLPIRRGQPLELCTRALPFARPLALGAFDEVNPIPARARARQEAELALLPSCLSLGVAAMELDPGTQLGGERLQLRYYALGGAQTTRGQQGVEVATWGRTRGPVDGGSLAFAQAEYYFDGEGSAAQEQADDLMTLGWRARFRRFRSPDLAREVGAACQQTGVARCAETAEPLSDLSRRIAH